MSERESNFADRERARHARRYNDAELAELLAAAANTLSHEPDQSGEAAQMAAIALSLEGRPVPRRRTPLLLSVTAYASKLLITACALMLSGVGLAYAGVDLPGTAAEKAVEKLTGLELPNQSGSITPVAEGEQPDGSDANGEQGEKEGKSDNGANGDSSRGGSNKDSSEGSDGNSVSAAVQSVRDSTEERGCEFGQAVAQAARDANEGGSNAAGAEKEKCDHEEGEEGSAFGSDDTAGPDNGKADNSPSKGGNENAGGGNPNANKDNPNKDEEREGGSDETGSSGNSGDEGPKKDKEPKDVPTEEPSSDPSDRGGPKDRPGTGGVPEVPEV